MGEAAILHDYFQAEVARTAADLNVEAPADTQLYVANLLARFAKSDELFTTMEGKNELEPLAFILKRALEHDQQGARMQILRHLGDTALYTSGFFADRIERRGVEVDYYIEMGGMAYSNVSTLARGGRGHQDLYAKLSQHFKDLVRVLWELAERTQMATTRGLLELYMKWEKTGCERLERKLLQSGFVLNSAAKPSEC